MELDRLREHAGAPRQRMRSRTGATSRRVNLDRSSLRLRTWLKMRVRAAAKDLLRTPQTRGGPDRGIRSSRQIASSGTVSAG